MAFAGVSKISAALAAQARALAAAHGVEAALEEELQELGPLAAAERVTGVAPRAWRWAPEMREIADTCAGAGLPPASPRALPSCTSAGTPTATRRASRSSSCWPTCGASGW